MINKNLASSSNMWICAAVACGIFALSFSFPFSKQIAWQFTILIHEFGHSLFAWLYGCPSIPSFDFVNHSGFAHIHDQKRTILWAMHIAFLGLIWYSRRAWLICAVICLIFAGYLISAHNGDWFKIVISYMGHGSESVFAGIFLYRGLSASSVHHSLERTLYFLCAFAFIAMNLEFAWKLMHNERFLYEYENDSRGILNDFHNLAVFHLRSDVPTVARFHFCFTLLCPAMAIFIDRVRAIYEDNDNLA